MTHGWTILLFVAGFAATAVASLGAAMPGAGIDAAGLRLVIARDPETVILRAGGTVIGPVSAPFAALSAGAGPDLLRASGAWAVTGVPLAILCEEGTS